MVFKRVSHSVVQILEFYLKCSWLEPTPYSRQAIYKEAEAFKKLKQCSPFAIPWNMEIKLGPYICILTRNAGTSLATLLDSSQSEEYIQHLADFLSNLENWIISTSYEVSVESLTINPWLKTKEKIISLLNEGDNHHSLHQVKTNLQTPPTARVFEEHGDLNLENIMFKQGKITLIDPRFGVYPIAFPYLKMLYMWTLLHSGADCSHLVVQKILESIQKMGLSEEIKVLLPTTLLRIKYPQMMEPKFHHLLNPTKSDEVIAILDFIWNNL